MSNFNLIKKGESLFKKKDFVKSLDTFFVVLRNNPKSVDALSFISYIYIETGNYKNALIYLDKLVNLDINSPDIFYNKGNCLYKLGNYKDATDCYKKSIKLKNNFYEAYVQLGQLLKKVNKLNEAIIVLKQALNFVLQKDSICVNISEIFFLKGDYKNSKKYANDALKFNNQNFLAIINIANCLIEEGQIEEGIKELENINKVKPNNPMVLNNLGFAYKYKGDYPRAIIEYKKAIKLNPEFKDALFNLSILELSSNNFIEGWVNYEHRWGTAKKFSIKMTYNKPVWNKNLGFERILIWGEQGIGEQLLFSSVLADLKFKFKKIILCVNDKLVDLFKENFKEFEVYPLSKKIDESNFDYHLPICSLGLYFRNNLKDFKFNKLKVEAGYNYVKKNKKLQCALTWKRKNIEFRDKTSINLEDLKDILLIDEIEFINIQYTDEDDEVKKFEKENNFVLGKVNGLDPFNDLYNLASFISKCDFVISISNTTAHLSAALGKPTYLMLPKNRGKLWYWDNDFNNQNLWYPSVVKFIQKTSKDWDDPIKNLKDHIFNKHIYSN